MEAYNFGESMVCFWKSATIYNESVLMVSYNGKMPEAGLLFKPAEIISVKNSHLDIEYTEYEDWVFEDGKLKLTENSRALFLTCGQLYPALPREGWTFPRIGGGYLLFQEGHHFHDLQLCVSYTHPGDLWKGPVPVFDQAKLPKTKAILQAKRKMKIVLNGDSISAGANASGLMLVPPFQPDWGHLFVRKLEEVYGSQIELINTSKGGETSEWGMQNVGALVSEYRPDLVILHFGTNDGTCRMPAEQYKKNIEGMIKNVRSVNPDAEFILISPLMPNQRAALPNNPEVSFYGEQEKYLPVLRTLEEDGIAAVDMISIHKELLRHKKYYDMSGNHVNHPNDFLIRWYAQVLCTTLIQD